MRFRAVHFVGPFVSKVGIQFLEIQGAMEIRIALRFGQFFPFLDPHSGLIFRPGDCAVETFGDRSQSGAGQFRELLVRRFGGQHPVRSRTCDVDTAANRAGPDFFHRHSAAGGFDIFVEDRIHGWFGVRGARNQDQGNAEGEPGHNCMAKRFHNFLSFI